MLWFLIVFRGRKVPHATAKDFYLWQLRELFVSYTHAVNLHLLVGHINKFLYYNEYTLTATEKGTHAFAKNLTITLYRKPLNDDGARLSPMKMARLQTKIRYCFQLRYSHLATSNVINEWSSYERCNRTKCIGPWIYKICGHVKILARDDLNIPSEDWSWFYNVDLYTFFYYNGLHLPWIIVWVFTGGS